MNKIRAYFKMYSTKATLQSLVVSVFALSHFSQNVLGTENRTFPPSVKFGAATAAYQVEGAWNEDGKGESIWDHLVHAKPDSITDGSTGDIAADSYHKCETDVALLKDLGVNYYRFSISWPRVLPTGYIAGGVNKAGVEYYTNLLNLLEENGIDAMVTLYHWDLPQTLQEDFGGFLNESFVDAYANYARLAFDLFGDKVRYWITFNEPFILCEQGFESGSKAPLITDNPGVDLYTCGHVLLKAHAAAFRIYDEEYRVKQDGKVGIALNTGWNQPLSDDPKDVEAAERSLLFRFGWFAHPLVHGDYPQVMIDRIANRSAQEGFEKSRLPEFTCKDIQRIKGSYDFIGINQYTTVLASAIEDIEIGEPSWNNDLSVVTTVDSAWEKTASSWINVVPWGMRKVLKWIKDTYNNPEVVVTENGFADAGGILQDDRRIHFLREYMSSLLGAVLDDEVNVSAYIVWSLIDTFEWNSGYTERFGLYSVNFTDPERSRTPKASAKFYKNVIRTRCLVSKCVGQ